MRLERQRQEDRVDASASRRAPRPRRSSRRRRRRGTARPCLAGRRPRSRPAQPRLGVVGELVDDGAARAPAPDDEDAAHAEPVAPRLLEVAADGRSRPRRRRGRRGRRRGRGAARVGSRGRRWRGRPGGASRAPWPRGRRAPPRCASGGAGPVEPVEVVDDRPEDGDEGEERRVVREGRGPSASGPHASRNG